jgi:hypothetical protein
MATPAHFTDRHADLHDFVGDWILSQKVWTDPKGKPATHRGKTKTVKILDGLATLMTTEMETTDFKGVALITYNKQQSHYDLAWLDSSTDKGILMMRGERKQTASHAAVLAEFGPSATLQREWGTAIANAAACLPHQSLDAAAKFATAGAHTATTASAIPIRLVENKISDTQWVLEFYIPGPEGKEFLVQQNTFTRA